MQNVPPFPSGTVQTLPEGPPQLRAPKSGTTGKKGSKGSADAFGPGRPTESVLEVLIRIAQGARNRRSRLVNRFSHHIVAGRPICLLVVVLIIVLTIVTLGLSFKPPKVETNLDSFMKADINCSLFYDAFLSAKEARDNGAPSALASESRVYDLVIAYELLADDRFNSIFDFEVLLGIGKFEQDLRAMPSLQELCNSADERQRNLCTPGLSIVNYMMPYQESARGAVVPEALRLDGLGRDAIPISAALRLLELHGLLRGILPRNFNMDAPMAVTTVRSVFRFKLPVNSQSTQSTSGSPSASASELDIKWKDFLREALPWLEERVDTGSFPVKIYLTGDLIEEVQVLDTLKSDCFFAIGSICLVYVYMICHTRSFFLSFTGLILFALATLLTYVVFATCVTDSLSISCFLAMFFMLGLTSEVFFVYVDFWRDSEKAGATLGSRVTWTYQRAGQATFASTTTLAVSCFVCLASILRPLREIGMLLALGAIFAWLLASLLCLPCCVLYDQRCAGRCAVLSCFGDSVRGELADRLSWGVQKLQWPCVIFAMLTGLAFLIVSLVSMDTNMSVPKVFPEGHNQHRGQDVMGDNFEALLDVLDHDFGVPPESVEVCPETTFDSFAINICSMFWCDVALTVPSLESGTECECYRRISTQTCGNKEQSPTALLVERFVGLSRQSSGQILGPIGDRIENEANLNGLSFVGDRAANLSSRNLKPLLLQEWESGSGSLEPMMEVRALLARGSNSAVCGWEDLCFCSGHICKLDDFWASSPSVSLAATRRLSESSGSAVDSAPAAAGVAGAAAAAGAAGAAGAAAAEAVEPATNGVPPGGMPSVRWLNGVPEWNVPATMRASVVVVFGIEVQDNTPLVGPIKPSETWTFQTSFQAKHPRAQRDMYALCTQAPANLLVTDRSCWIERFHFWLLSRGERFPAPMQTFNSLATKFVESYPSTGAPYLWMRGGEVRASYVEFTVDVDKAEEPKKVRSYKEEWDKYLIEWNVAASPFSRGAWHASAFWQRGEAERDLVISTAVTMGILLACTFVVLVFFTFDVVLSLFVLASAAWIMSSLLFFMTVVLSWEFGPIEMMALLAFSGYAFTHSVHVVLLYRNEEAESESLRSDLSERAAARYQHTSYALRATAGAVTGSAISMAASAFFMLFCTLNLFSKLGATLLVTSLLTLPSSLAILPAGLFLGGPISKRMCCSSLQRWKSCHALLLRMRASGMDTDEQPLSPQDTDSTSGGRDRDKTAQNRENSRESAASSGRAESLALSSDSGDRTKAKQAKERAPPARAEQSLWL